MKETIARVAVSGVSYWFDRPYSYAIPQQFISQIQAGMRVAVPFGGARPREGIVLSLERSSLEHPLKSICDLLDEEPILTTDQIHLALWMRERFFCTVSEAVRSILPAGLWYKISPQYTLSDQTDEAKAMAAAGKSKAEQLVIQTLYSHGGSCSLGEIENAFGTKNAGPALSSLVKKGIIHAEASRTRSVSDRTIQKVALAVSPEVAQRAIESSKRAIRQCAVLRVLCDLNKATLADLCYFTGAGRDSVRRLEEKGLVTITQEEYYRRPSYECGEQMPLPVLNTEQKKVFDGIWALTQTNKPNAALLFGVTGSGKTTVYIHLIDRILKSGKSAILLVPEIALTPQMLKTFSSYFGDEIAVLHSALSMGERYDEWKRIRNGQAHLVIGTRSAIFAPVQNAGIIIIDEEQEDTYKSENGSRYHAKDVAKFLCAEAKCTLLLGSATPEIRSMYYAETSRYKLFQLTKRYNQQMLPTVQIVDMKQELRNGNGGELSDLLCRELQKNIDCGEQSILFLNRRGTNKLVSCSNCGYTYQCPNCSCSLTYHSIGNRLMCHYCGHVQTPDVLCPECGGKLSFIGAGTQKIVEELNERFPDVEILRMDTDSLSSENNHAVMFEKFQSHKIPIMVGTQMVTKGLNFENVTLVGVLSADQSLYAGSYLASERTFSLITQVIGRSGRFSKAGRAVIQSFTPENQVIRFAAAQDYKRFYESELEIRRMTDSPPFSEIFVLTAIGEDEDAVLHCCADIRALLLQETNALANTKVLGPAPLPVARLNKTWRYRVTVASAEAVTVRKIISAALTAFNSDKKYRGVSVYADFDPLDN